ncbi:TetR/AcrR family transcriptional regulator [Clostridium drakei]|uniref:TetR family transcriptional regulator n=1 Tax=Clostridium drakei TaxID=332101 RepID=A0A2U8DR52_9CLOT|nr:TetR/AcrR family transcriptional regulator [Clostridium drakei]AWI04935.1 TetR family transcriptional regulator [Clostridium drakei]
MPKVGMEPIRKSQIINSTLECICMVGIEKMSLDMVAKEADCSKGVISYYFKSKDNLILEAFKSFLSYYNTKINSEVRENMKPFEILQIVQKNALPEYYNIDKEAELKINVSEIRGVEAMNIPPAKKAKLFVSFFSRAMLDTNLQSVLQEVYKDDYKGILSIISYGNEIGIFKETDASKSAYAVMALYIGISMLRVVGFKPEEINDDIDVFWSVVNSMFGK